LVGTAPIIQKCVLERDFGLPNDSSTFFWAVDKTEPVGYKAEWAESQGEKIGSFILSWEVEILHSALWAGGRKNVR
jgi:hypothetical protein